ncbi:fumarylacetoacetate hydrolase family protein [Sciscionella marina]|uniref:fumarylacetoacetate hydrolase family protein n=1 Tax=Sciscionella marina TaxID=508770 RepID=UPI000360A779|nr:fumarylacetoacetate hydrolase family protein [Sciscionella marina]
MRIARFTVGDGPTKVGSVAADTVTELLPRPGSSPDDLLIDLLERAAKGRLPKADEVARAGGDFDLGDVELQSPIRRPGKLLAVGLNYADHTKESGMRRPEVPVVFTKQGTCVTGPFSPIVRPRASSQIDYEGELGVVIGRRCRHVPARRAREVVGGYLVVNDVSVRDWQLATPTMTLGKSWDTHGPLGPWITTTDDVPDPHDLRVRTWVCGELRQDGSTRDLLTDVDAIIAHISTACTLEPGDIIATGTPAGVGHAMSPPRYLRAGDTVRIEIEGLGSISNTVVDELDDAAYIEGDVLAGRSA